MKKPAFLNDDSDISELSEEQQHEVIEYAKQTERDEAIKKQTAGKAKVEVTPPPDRLGRWLARHEYFAIYGKTSLLTQDEAERKTPDVLSFDPDIARDCNIPIPSKKASKKAKTRNRTCAGGINAALLVKYVEIRIKHKLRKHGDIGKTQCCWMPRHQIAKTLGMTVDEVRDAQTRAAEAGKLIVKKRHRNPYDHTLFMSLKNQGEFIKLRQGKVSWSVVPSEIAKYGACAAVLLQMFRHWAVINIKDGQKADNNGDYWRHEKTADLAKVYRGIFTHWQIKRALARLLQIGVLVRKPYIDIDPTRDYRLCDSEQQKLLQNVAENSANKDGAKIPNRASQETKSGELKSQIYTPNVPRTNVDETFADAQVPPPKPRTTLNPLSCAYGASPSTPAKPAECHFKFLKSVTRKVNLSPWRINGLNPVSRDNGESVPGDSIDSTSPDKMACPGKSIKVPCKGKDHSISSVPGGKFLNVPEVHKIVLPGVSNHRIPTSSEIKDLFEKLDLDSPQRTAAAETGNSISIQPPPAAHLIKRKKQWSEMTELEREFTEAMNCLRLGPKEEPLETDKTVRSDYWKLYQAIFNSGPQNRIGSTTPILENAWTLKIPARFYMLTLMVLHKLKSPEPFWERQLHGDRALARVKLYVKFLKSQFAVADELHLAIILKVPIKDHIADWSALKARQP